MKDKKVSQEGILLERILVISSLEMYRPYALGGVKWKYTDFSIVRGSCTGLARVG